MHRFRCWGGCLSPGGLLRGTLCSDLRFVFAQGRAAGNSVDAWAGAPRRPGGTGGRTGGRPAHLHAQLSNTRIGASVVKRGIGPGISELSAVAHAVAGGVGARGFTRLSCLLPEPDADDSAAGLGRRAGVGKKSGKVKFSCLRPCRLSETDRSPCLDSVKCAILHSDQRNRYGIFSPSSPPGRLSEL